jgi:hypothetical protein
MDSKLQTFKLLQRDKSENASIDMMSSGIP